MDAGYEIAVCISHFSDLERGFRGDIYSFGLRILIIAACLPGAINKKKKKKMLLYPSSRATLQKACAFTYCLLCHFISLGSLKMKVRISQHSTIILNLKLSFKRLAHLYKKMAMQIEGNKNLSSSN